MPKLIMLKGLPGSGKSTWAREQALGNKVKRVNKDDLRMMLDNGKYSKKNEELVLKIRDLIVNHSLCDNYDVIVDDTNLDPKHEASLRKSADWINGFCGMSAKNPNRVRFIIKDFTDVPLEECLARNSKRTDDRVPDDVIIEMHRKYLT